ncbi:NepR family anti-sigma factor [Hyphomicrobium sp.]|uniref:NepR family anti-sigma factor n=1 Tax=Hyphomicrobium sp. TaxID=82 RepID=UPI002D7A0B43|nr:NepR family anti-sigma factor [Hyphomicrobium sp.]HET6389034.1 NepR family anti-sigma factor [Hyphomicrobium sp.]
MGTGSDPKRGDSAVMQAPLPVELQGQIGQRLREAYVELINEPVPDRFVELLQKLKQREEESKEDSRDEK